MATEFSREFFADNRIVKASLRCAHKLREKDLDRIKSEIKKLYDATEVILNITVDESLLSGYVLQVGDRVFDNSGRHQLDKMMEGKPSLATLKTRIEDYKPAETSAEGGVVISSADGIVHIDGMNRAVYGEIVTFENGAKGMVESVEPEQLGVMLFDGAETVGVGTMVTRKLRELTDKDIQKLADIYNAYVDGTLEEIKGFCAVATTEEIAKQDYILTPGRYVGIEEQKDDGEPFEEKMTRLTKELSEMFRQSHELEAQIRERLRGIGYEV